MIEVVALPLLDGLEEEGLEEGLGLSEDTRVEMVTGILFFSLRCL